MIGKREAKARRYQDKNSEDRGRPVYPEYPYSQHDSKEVPITECVQTILKEWLNKIHKIPEYKHETIFDFVHSMISKTEMGEFRPSSTIYGVEWIWNNTFNEIVSYHYDDEKNNERVEHKPIKDKWGHLLYYEISRNPIDIKKNPKTKSPFLRVSKEDYKKLETFRFHWLRRGIPEKYATFSRILLQIIDCWEAGSPILYQIDGENIPVPLGPKNRAIFNPNFI